MPKYKRKVLLCISDMHSGFSLGLCNPKTRLWHNDGEKYRVSLSETQKWLWDKVFVPGVDNTMLLAEKDPVYAFSMGDITHGNKYVSQQMTTRAADQEDLAVDVLSHILKHKKVKSLRNDIGTPAHNYGEASAETRVFERLRLLFPKKDINLTYHGLSALEGFKIDHAHHGPRPGSREWTKPNAAVNYLRDRMLKDLDIGKEPPNLYLRGHYHDYVKALTSIESKGIDYDSCLVVCPPLCVLGDWGRQVTQSLPRIRAGVIAIEIIDGQMRKPHKFMETLELRKEEKLL